MLLAMLLLVTAPEKSPGALSLELTAAKTRVMVGEPAKLILKWTTRERLLVATGSVVLKIDDGSGFRPWTEAKFGTAFVLETPAYLSPGEVQKTSLVLGVAGGPSLPEKGPNPAEGFRFAFPRAGEYRVRVDYERTWSNTVVISAVQPQGEDAELWNRLSSRPDLLTEWVLYDGRRRGALRELVSKYPHSAHLAAVQLVLFRSDLGQALATDRKASIPLKEGSTARLLGEVEARVLADSPFDEDRLILLAEYSSALGDQDGLERVYRAILRDHPDGVGAERAQSWLASNEPPK